MNQRPDEQLAYEALKALTGILCDTYADVDEGTGLPWESWNDCTQTAIYWEKRIGSWSEFLGECDNFTQLLPAWNEDTHHQNWATIERYALEALQLLDSIGPEQAQKLNRHTAGLTQ